MMKKVTVKQLMLLSLFVAMAWSASAQMKVGDNPNTINKGSILELEAKDKGVLYPRVALTASNVWAPLQGTAVEGMAVFNTATVTATTSATTTLTPGFYFWEGAKWNKLATNAEVDEGAEWVYDPITKQTNLKRSGKAPFTNKVYFDENGNYRNYQANNVDVWNYNSNQWEVSLSKNNKAGHFLQKESKNLELINSSKKILEDNTLLVNEQGNTDNYQMIGGFNSVKTVKDNTSNYDALNGARSDARHFGLGNIRYITGHSSFADVINGSSDGYVMSYRASASSHSSNDVKKLVNYGAYAVLETNAGNVNEANLLYGHISYLNNNNSTVQESHVFDVSHLMYSGATPTINSAAGFYYRGIRYLSSSTPATPTINNNYGIFLEDIDEGQKNYAIYTNAGDVRIGDLAGTGSLSTSTTDKVVVADTDGVLKTKTAATLVAEVGEWKDGTVSGTTLIYANQAKKAGNDVVITDEGLVGIGLDTPLATLHVKGRYMLGDLEQGIILNSIDKQSMEGAQIRLSPNIYAPDSLGLKEWTIDQFYSPNLPALFRIFPGEHNYASVRAFTIAEETGNVGIGIGGEVAASEKLEVNGNVKATTFISATKSYPDYVFENYYNGTSELNCNYEFKTLSEIENFVKTNGHLPGYVSAKEVQLQGGFDMTQTQLKNIEKIEELYLHTIEQEKKIQNYKRELEELKSLVQQLLEKK